MMSQESWTFPDIKSGIVRWKHTDSLDFGIESKSFYRFFNENHNLKWIILPKQWKDQVGSG